MLCYDSPSVSREQAEGALQVSHRLVPLHYALTMQDVDGAEKITVSYWSYKILILSHF